MSCFCLAKPTRHMLIWVGKNCFKVSWLFITFQSLSPYQVLINSLLSFNSITTQHNDLATFARMLALTRSKRTLLPQVPSPFVGPYSTTGSASATWNVGNMVVHTGGSRAVMKQAQETVKTNDWKRIERGYTWQPRMIPKIPGFVDKHGSKLNRWHFPISDLYSIL